MNDSPYTPGTEIRIWVDPKDGLRAKLSGPREECIAIMALITKITPEFADLFEGVKFILNDQREELDNLSKIVETYPYSS